MSRSKLEQTRFLQALDLPSLREPVASLITAEGTLAIRESNETCVTPAGRVATGTYEVDGLFSTGVFAGATGSGTLTNLLDQGHVVTLSGKLNLANDEG